MKYQELYNMMVSPSKRQADKKNVWLYFVVRPVSIVSTLPLLKTKITPTQVTIFSVVVSLVAFCLLTIGYNNMWLKVVGWFLFFSWGVLDCIDGNMARAKNQCTLKGELWDALGGYLSMILIYTSAGIVAYFEGNIILGINPFWVLIGGFTTALVAIFPRLVMHKKKCIYKEFDNISEFQDKANFNPVQAFTMNFISVISLLQVLLLVCIVLHRLDIFVLCYCFLNSAIMLFSLYKMLK